VILCEHDTDTLVCRTCGHVASRLPTYRECVRPGGPGTELKKLLAIAGIVASPDCTCNARAAEMDRNGPAWCEENIGTVCGWLREQAEARGLPFLEIAAKMLVRRAIRNARRLD
jgi:hypothetical protein